MENRKEGFWDRPALHAQPNLVEGTRVRLREWRPDELEAMHRWLGSPEVTRFLTWGAKSLDDSARHLELCVSEQTKPERTRYYLAAELRRSGEVMGDAGFEWVDREQREGELGYFLLPAYWRQGIGSECARLVLQLAFGRCGALAMRASCDARNVASERVMQKCGMRRDTEVEKPGRRSYRITRAEWLLDAGPLA